MPPVVRYRRPVRRLIPILALTIAACTSSASSSTATDTATDPGTGTAIVADPVPVVAEPRSGAAAPCRNLVTGLTAPSRRPLIVGTVNHTPPLHRRPS